MTMKTSLYYEVYGKGDPLFLIPGLDASIYVWRKMVPLLAKDFSLILVDLKGFGKSPKPRDNRYSIYDQAELVTQLITQNNLRNLTIAGHSFGGAVALATTLRLQESNPGLVKSLVLLDSAAYDHEKIPIHIKLLGMPGLGYFMSLISVIWAKTVIKAVLPRMFYDPAKVSEETISAYAQPLRSWQGLYILKKTAEQLLPKDFFSTKEKYAGIVAPTLLLWGKQDRIVPLAVGKRLNQTIKQSQLIVIDKCGHALPEEQPEQAVSAILGFLKSCPKTNEIN